VTRDPRGRLVPVGPRPSYLPATLVSGVRPMAMPGIDLGGDAGVAEALTRASTLYDAGATPLETLRDGTKGLFLVKLAPRLSRGIVSPGFVVVFASELWLRSAVTETAPLRLTVGDTASAHRGTAGMRRYFKRVNPAVEQVLGYIQEELLGRPYLDFVHPDDRDRTETEAGAPTGEGRRWRSKTVSCARTGRTECSTGRQRRSSTSGSRTGWHAT
jgi:PAS domain S-box-containing protein